MDDAGKRDKPRSLTLTGWKRGFCAFLLFWATVPTASAADGIPVVQQRLAETDKALFLELVELAKFNVHFHLEANRHQPWRQITYPLGRESGTALTFAATLIDLNQQARGLDNIARISRKQLKKAVDCGITGNAISGGSSALELAQNTFMMLRARNQGYSPSRSLEYVKTIVANTDRLLDERDKLTQQEESSDRRRILELETSLVRRIRQQLLFEFATWSAHSRDQAWRENTFFTLDSLQSFTRMGAGILAKKSFKQREYARPSAICALIANSVATVNPIVRNFAGIAIRKHQQRLLAKEIPCDRPSIPSMELDQLQEKMSTNPNPDWLAKVVSLTHRTEILDKALDRETRDIERYRQIAQQQSVTGPIIGLTGVASSTLATVAVYRYSNDLETANKLGFSGRITQGTGQAFALLYTPYTVLSGIIKNRRLASQGQLPSQVLQARLRRLELMEVQP